MPSPRSGAIPVPGHACTGRTSAHVVRARAPRHPGADGARVRREPHPRTNFHSSASAARPGTTAAPGRPLAPSRRAGRTGHAPVPAGTLSWDTRSATLERTASQHGASPIPEQTSIPARVQVRPAGRRPPQDPPSKFATGVVPCGSQR
eukprot:6541401-Prymnesium_polylepis.1